MFLWISSVSVTWEDVYHTPNHTLKMGPGNLCFNKPSPRAGCTCLRTTTLATFSLSICDKGQSAVKKRAGEIPSARSFGRVEGWEELTLKVLYCYPSSRKMQNGPSNVPSLGYCMAADTRKMRSTLDFAPPHGSHTHHAFSAVDSRALHLSHAADIHAQSSQPSALA